MFKRQKSKSKEKKNSEIILRWGGIHYVYGYYRREKTKIVADQYSETTQAREE